MDMDTSRWKPFTSVSQLGTTTHVAFRYGSPDTGIGIGLLVHDPHNKNDVRRLVLISAEKDGASRHFWYIPADSHRSILLKRYPAHKYGWCVNTLWGDFYGDGVTLVSVGPRTVFLPVGIEVEESVP